MQSPVPVFVHSLGALSKILDKAEAQAEQRKIAPAVLAQLRLIADMLPLWRQVTIACDHAKGAAARLAGLEVPSFPDAEMTIPELKDRIGATLAFLATIPDAAFEQAGTRTINLRAGGRDLSFPAGQYLYGYAIPNFYFHMTTAYAILRANGFAIGKTDFLGA